MHEAEILIAGLLVAVAGLSALARHLSIPYPIVLVIGGAAFGFIPGMPEIRLNPDVVLVVFLPLCCMARPSTPTSATSAPTCAATPSARWGWCWSRWSSSPSSRTR